MSPDIIRILVRYTALVALYFNALFNEQVDDIGIKGFRILSQTFLYQLSCQFINPHFGHSVQILQCY